MNVFMCGPNEPTEEDRVVAEFAAYLREQATEQDRRQAEASNEESEYGL